MRKGVVLFAPAILAIASVIACSSQGRRSAFATDPDPTEPDYQPGLGLHDLDGGDGEGGCSNSQTTIMRTPVVIEFVVDASGSMDTSSPPRWPAARDALLAAFAEMEKAGDSSTFVGLQRYGGTLGKRVLPGPMTDPNHYDDLVQTIDTAKAGEGGTATETALKEGFRVVERFKPPTSSGLSVDDMKRVVVLMSDGAPTGQEPEKNRCIDLVESKFQAQPPLGPILTFAVGIGDFPSSSDYDPAFMGRLAQRGGTAPAGCNPEATNSSSVCHFQVTPGENVDATKQALLEAINKIRALSASCEFGFETNKSTDLGKLEVVVTDKDGNVSSIPKDPYNGWSFDDEDNPKKVILNGDACSATNGVVSGRVDVIIGCKTAN